jgi:hypothetical protein
MVVWDLSSDIFEKPPPSACPDKYQYLPEMDIKAISHNSLSLSRGLQGICKENLCKKIRAKENRTNFITSK